MSVKYMHRVWTNSQAKGAVLLLMLAIADNANDSGMAWPGNVYLARKMRMSERQVRRLIDICELDLKELQVRRRPGKSNIYRILTPDKMSMGEISTPDISDVTPDISDTDPGHFEQNPDVVRAESVDEPLTIKEPFNEPIKRIFLELGSYLGRKEKKHLRAITRAYVKAKNGRSELVLIVPDETSRLWLEDRCNTTIKNLARGILFVQDIQVSFLGGEHEQSNPP